MICFKYAKVIFFQILRIILNNFLAQSGLTGTLKETKFIYFAHIRTPTGCFFLYKYYLCQERCPGIQ